LGDERRDWLLDSSPGDLAAVDEQTLKEGLVEPPLL
jgi:hypothetical protein